MNIIIWIFGIFWAMAGAQNIEQAARKIEGELMAPCCWTQTVDQHNSGASAEIQEQVRTMLMQGKNRDEIIAHYVSQYGQRILAVPPAKGFNLTVFVLPGFFLVMGSGVVFLAIRSWKKAHRAERVRISEGDIEQAYAERLAQALKEQE